MSAKDTEYEETYAGFNSRDHDDELHIWCDDCGRELDDLDLEKIVRVMGAFASKCLGCIEQRQSEGEKPIFWEKKS